MLRYSVYSWSVGGEGRVWKLLPHRLNKICIWLLARMHSDTFEITQRYVLKIIRRHAILADVFDFDRQFRVFARLRAYFTTALEIRSTYPRVSFEYSKRTDRRLRPRFRPSDVFESDLTWSILCGRSVERHWYGRKGNEITVVWNGFGFELLKWPSNGVSEPPGLRWKSQKKTMFLQV